MQSLSGPCSLAPMFHGTSINQSHLHTEIWRLPSGTERNGQQVFCCGQEVHPVQSNQHPACPLTQPSRKCCRVRHCHIQGTHFIAALATVDMLCPFQLWDEFLPQIKLTLNMLRFSRRNPKKSANQEAYGSFDFNKTPLAPLLGTKALVYSNPGSQTSCVDSLES
jgi:hypothetical protein